MYKIVIVFIATFILQGENNPEKSKYLTDKFKVIAVADGDTFSILSDKKVIRIRVEGIDAPEKGMPYYKVSKQYLSTLCFNKWISLKVITVDRYGRIVARVILPNGKDISTQMIKNGMAWHYKHYSKDKLLAAYEIRARKNKVGLWKDKNPMAPWEVRKLHRKGISTKPQPKIVR